MTTINRRAHLSPQLSVRKHLKIGGSPDTAYILCSELEQCNQSPAHVTHQAL